MMQIRSQQNETPISVAAGSLAGADLQGRDMEGACLRGADLTGAHLCRANLRRADLEGACLRGITSSRWWRTPAARFEVVLRWIQVAVFALIAVWFAVWAVLGGAAWGWLLAGCCAAPIVSAILRILRTPTSGSLNL